MNKLNLRIKLSLLLLVVFTVECCTSFQNNKQLGFEEIQLGFISPTENISIRCYWYWMNDDISKEGITKDLEAMKEAGIGTAFIGNIYTTEKDGKVPVLSEEWWECMVHAVNEVKRIGVDIGSFNCPGWSMSGGPWIESDKTMRHLAYSETSVKGGKKVEIQLHQPKTEFQDAYVLAFPKDKKEDVYLNNSNSTILVNPSVKNVPINFSSS